MTKHFRPKLFDGLNWLFKKSTHLKKVLFHIKNIKVGSVLGSNFSSLIMSSGLWMKRPSSCKLVCHLRREPNNSVSSFRMPVWTIRCLLRYIACIKSRRNGSSGSKLSRTRRNNSMIRRRRKCCVPLQRLKKKATGLCSSMKRCSQGDQYPRRNIGGRHRIWQSTRPLSTNRPWRFYRGYQKKRVKKCIWFSLIPLILQNSRNT